MARQRAARARGATIPLLVLLLCLCPGPPLAAQLLSPTRSLLEIRTAFFDIYFPPELGPEARRLALFADELRGELSPLFGAAGSARFPVLLVDGEAQANGYFTVSPSSRIVLFLSPPAVDDSIGGFDDSLRKIFLHELTHAISTTRRSPTWQAATLLFGDLASPASFLSPVSLAEGASVSTESDEGRGRLGDPIALGVVAEALLEKKPPTFWQAAGARDLYPFGSAWYFYGGGFTTWLRRHYGAKAYASFWGELAKGDLLDSLEGGLFSVGFFKRSFGHKLDEAWKAFLEDARPQNPTLARAQRILPAKAYITALATHGSSLFWADASAGGIFRLDRGARTAVRIHDADSSVNALSVSADGKRLLVSLGEIVGTTTRLALREIDLGSGRLLPRGFGGLREAAYLSTPPKGGDPYAFSAIRVRGLDTDLVLVEGDRPRLIKTGSVDLAFGRPQSLDGSLFWATARVGGEKRIARIEGSDGSMELLSLPPGYTGVKDLFLDAKGLVFAVALPAETGLGLSGLATWRLATLDFPPEGSLRIGGASLLGGVHLPLRLEGGNYALVGRFSDGEYLEAYPIPGGALAGPSSDARASPQLGDPAGLPNGPQTDLLGGSRGSVGDAAALVPGEALFQPYTATRETTVQPQRATGEGEPLEKKAPPLPLLLRASRLPSLGEGLDAAGLSLAGEDLAGRLVWSLLAEYAWETKTANLDLGLVFGLSPWSLGLRASDLFKASGDGKSYKRLTGGGIELARVFHGWPSRRVLDLDLLAKATAVAAAAVGGRLGEAYGAAYEYADLGLRTRLDLSDLRASFFPPFPSQGYSLTLVFDAELPSLDSPPVFGAEAAAGFHFAPLRLSVSAFAELSLDGSPRFSTTGAYLGDGARPAGLEALAPVYAEFQTNRSLAGIYLFAEARSLVLPIEVQTRLLGPFYLRRLGLDAGARAAWLGGRLSGAGEPLLLASVFLRIDVEFCLLVGNLARAGLIPRIEAAYSLTPQVPATGGRLSWNFLFDTRL